MAIIDTTSPAYQNRLNGLTNLYDDFRDLYGAVVKRMTGDQLRDLRSRDPLFAKFIEIGRDVAKLSERVGGTQ